MKIASCVLQVAVSVCIPPKIPQLERFCVPVHQILYRISVDVYGERSGKHFRSENVRNKDVFEDAINHENPNYLCKYFGRGCPYKEIKFMEKITLKPSKKCKIM